MLLQFRTVLLTSLALALAGPCAAGTNPRHLPPAPAAFTYDAVVSEHGDLARGTGAISATRTGKGHYLVAFDADLSACVVVAAFGRASTDGGAYEKPGFISTSLTDDPGVVAVSTGGLLGRQRERSFHLIVGC
ncbi:MAG TPA: hypothetical protein VMF58_18395 [Rhizomicrobium sp.]|nr:hypothetical protein [Rhizomicrobium sp.]